MGASKKAGKLRIDQLLVERGLAVSRTRAQALILAGRVVVGDNRVDKPGQQVAIDSSVRLKGGDHPFVSRGGLKLQGALDAFDFDVSGFVCLDVGASTGGFSDCLLQRGAAKIFALDVGRAQLHQKLRADARVVVMERHNARYLLPAQLGEPADLAVFDLSFISLELVIEPVRACLKPGGRMILLVKPQFEVGRGQVGKGGIVRDPEKRERAVAKIVSFCEARGLRVSGRCESPITGAEGNVEYLVLVETL
jgi:23S rRNA (cytidine1920-2'-O)/16S rRNA (cytidine1409-2'-O)-methyltransferase